MGKAKLIKSTEGTKSNPQGKWYVHDQIKPFIHGIITGDLDIRQVSSTLISGVPTPWARAKLFWFAFDYLQHQDVNIKTSGLFEFYGILRDEWKGMMALIALFPDRVKFSEPVYLNPKEYGLTGAFGRMLLDDEDIWTDQIAKQHNPDELPYVQLLHYDGQLIGATSPFSIVFPAVEYGNLKNTSEINWYRNGKFEDPIRFLDRDKMQKLYLFLKNINDNFKEYEDNINISRPNNRLNLSGLKKCLREWIDEIKLKENNLQKNGTVAKYSNLAMPYKNLLASVQKVYQLDSGEFTFEKPADESRIREVLGDLQNILKEDKKIAGWNESSDFKNPLSNAAVYYLKVNDAKDRDNPTKYFALPLSMEGIQLFGQNLRSLVNQTDKNHTISGKIGEQGNLIVDLTVYIDNQPYKLNSKEYEIEWATMNNKVMIWPNFISDNWDRYYLYSEYPLNVQGIKFVPFFKRGLEQKIITVERQHGDKTVKRVVYSNSTETEWQDGSLEITYLVTYPAGQVPHEMHKYEVMKVNRPIAGLEIRIEDAGKTQIAGYLIVKNPGDESMGEKKIVDLTTVEVRQDATVGIDFGSNNSCVHFTLTHGDAQPIPFKNRRLALVGIDTESGTIAERDELLFFSNEAATNGQIKSWLHEHDIRYISSGDKGKEIAGGVAVNEKNILVKEMDKQIIKTQAGTLHYNMKWLSDTEGNLKKTAFLKALWLSICADLYEQKRAPKELRWSFPGSMSAFDRNQYTLIYNGQLPSITPILDKNNGTRLQPNSVIKQTEAEAVCRYALSKEIGLTRSNMFLGIDVGGSTSDILILARGDIGVNNEPQLYKQSSVRIAAGVFFDAVIKSATFRKAIYDFHQGQRKIKVENIREILSEGRKAPFYLNSVFDQLTKNDFSAFYSFIGLNAPFVYAIPAYVSGLLVFYSGALCAKTIRENHHLSECKEVHLFPFGKGGRLFYWLQTNPGADETNAYYEECFKGGFGEGAEKMLLKYRKDIADDNKSEVSKGLVVDKSLHYDKKVRYISDIFAEKNIRFPKDGQYIFFKEDDVVSGEYFEKIGQFDFPDKLENFETFLKIFIDFVSNKTGFVSNIAALKNHNLSGRLASFIQNDSEYAKARLAKEQTGSFDYRFPIFIAEGLCYLQQILIPEIFKS